MEKKTERAIFIILVAGIILFVSLFLLQGASSYKFEYAKENVLFVSNEAEPGQLMREFNLNDTVFVSPALFDQGAGNNYVLASFNLSQVVFIGNDKNTVSLWRVLDRNNSLSYCRTNNGDISKDIELSASDCQKILDDKNNAVVVVSLPSKEKKSIIVFSQNRIEIIPDRIENSAKASYVFLKTMYGNADLIIKKTNQFTEFVK